jgi:acyl-CoA thioester hydrolase
VVVLRLRDREDGHRARGIRDVGIGSDGGWLDLVARKLIAPPEDLLAALNAMPRTAEFEALPSSLKK